MKTLTINLSGQESDQDYFVQGTLSDDPSYDELRRTFDTFASLVVPKPDDIVVNYSIPNAELFAPKHLKVEGDL